MKGKLNQTRLDAKGVMKALNEKRVYRGKSLSEKTLSDKYRCHFGLMSCNQENNEINDVEKQHLDFEKKKCCC